MAVGRGISIPGGAPPRVGEKFGDGDGDRDGSPSGDGHGVKPSLLPRSGKKPHPHSRKKPHPHSCFPAWGKIPVPAYKFKLLKSHFFIKIKI